MNLNPITVIKKVFTVQKSINRCVTETASDGTQYITEFDNDQTGAIRHTVIRPDGTTETWGTLADTN